MNSGFAPAARFIVVAGAFVLVVAGMRAAAPLITPFLLALFIAVISAPPLFYLKRQRLPTWLAMLAVIAFIITIGGLVAALLSESLTAFAANLPEYQARLKALTLDLLTWLDGLGVHVPRQALTEYLDPAKALRFAGILISGLGNVLADAFLILITVVFILLEASGLPAKLQAALRDPTASMERLQGILDSVNHYMMLKTSTSLATGVFIWLWLWLLGLDFPVLWGTVAFLLNFVPTIGSIIAAAPALLLALVQLDPQSVLWVAAGYLLVNTVIGNLIEPKFMGEGLGLSTLVVFVSLVFWGWILGPVGMFLSVPLTMTLKIALDADPDTRPIAIMLGPQIATAAPAEKADDGRPVA